MSIKAPSKSKKISFIILTSAILLIPIIIFIITSINKHSYEHSARVEFIVAPQNAQITLDDSTRLNSGIHQLKPGTYRARFEQVGFMSQDYDFVAIANETTSILIRLTPTTDNADFYLNHPADAAIADSIIGNRHINASIQLEKSYPIINILPINLGRSRFRIDYGISPDETASFTLFITDYKGNSREEALEYIRAYNYNPDDYQITYQYRPEEYLAY